MFRSTFKPFRYASYIGVSGLHCGYSWCFDNADTSNQFQTKRLDRGIKFQANIAKLSNIVKKHGPIDDQVEYKQRIDLIRYLQQTGRNKILPDDFVTADVHGKFPPMDSLILQEMEQMLTDINELKSIENSDKIDAIRAGRARALKLQQEQNHQKQVKEKVKKTDEEAKYRALFNDLLLSETYESFSAADSLLSQIMTLRGCTKSEDLPLEDYLRLSQRLRSVQTHQHPNLNSKTTMDVIGIIAEVRDIAAYVDINENDLAEKHLTSLFISNKFKSTAELPIEARELLPNSLKSYSIMDKRKSSILDDSEGEYTSDFEKLDPKRKVKVKAQTSKDSNGASRSHKFSHNSTSSTGACTDCGCREFGLTKQCCVVCSHYGRPNTYDSNGEKIFDSGCKCHGCGERKGEEKYNSSLNRDYERQLIDQEVMEFDKYAPSCKSRYLRQTKQVLGVIDKESKHGRYSYSFKIGTAAVSVKCCMEGFLKVYKMSERKFFNHVDEIKQRSYAPENLDTSCKNIKDVHEMEDRALRFYGFELSDVESQSLIVPEWKAQSKGNYSNNLLTKEECIAWMRFYFENAAENQPNRYNQRHLRQASVTKEIVYEQYVKEISTRTMASGCLNYAQFCKVWRECFPKVLIQKFVAVQTKCNTCADLDALAENCGDNKELLFELRELRKLHSTFYRAQRSWYHDVRELAIQMPSRYISCIGDGMAQAHNVLPSYSKSGGGVAPATFDTHFQGFITHGVGCTIFRSFGNVGKGTNVAVHAWLVHLEREYKRRNNTLPDTLYYQIDGGPENANAVPIAMAELLVHWGLTKKVVITRLPPGHTHEDIDGIFGVIWKHCWRKNILTPQQQKELTTDAFRDKIALGATYDVVDVFAVPDYRKYFLGNGNNNEPPCAILDRAFKGYLSKMQFIVTKVDVSSEFPLGAKTVCREYPTEEAIEIIKTKYIPFKDGVNKGLSGLTATKLKCVNRPTTEDNNGACEGMRILNRVPNGTVPVAPFKKIKLKDDKGKGQTFKDVVDDLKHVVRKMCDDQGETSPVGLQWKAFLNIFPQGTSEEYVQSSGNNYHLPFEDFFNRRISTYSYNDTNPIIRNVSSWAPCGMRLVESVGTSSMQWGVHTRGFDGTYRAQKCPRVFPNHDEQGLTTQYLTSETTNRKKVAPNNPYANQKLPELKALCTDRDIDSKGLQRKELIQRLLDNDNGVVIQRNDSEAKVCRQPKTRYNKFKLDDLRRRCFERDLPVSGTKKDLIKRLEENDGSKENVPDDNDALVVEEKEEDVDDIDNVGGMDVDDAVEDIDGIDIEKDVCVADSKEAARNFNDDDGINDDEAQGMANNFDDDDKSSEFENDEEEEETSSCYSQTNGDDDRKEYENNYEAELEEDPHDDDTYM